MRKLFLPLLLASALHADVFTDIRANNLTALPAADPNTRDRNGVTPLLYASAFGSLETMKALLDKGADPNAADNAGSTPLLWAACLPDRVELLLARGADAKTKNKNNRTPLLAAATCPAALKSVQLLLAKGADPNAVDADGQSPLIEAVFSGGPAVAHALLDAGANPNRPDAGGFTPLMGAVGQGDPSLVKRLLAKGANVNAANTFAGKVVHGDIMLKQLTPLMMAAAYASPEIIQTLLDAGANVNARDSRGMTPLQFAVASATQDVKVVNLLIARGADVNVVSQMGETALDWARKFNHAPVLDALAKAGAKGSPIPPAPTRKSPPLAPRAAAEKSLPLIQSSAASFFAKSNCIACHHQPLAAQAVKAARDAGVAVDQKQFDLMKRTMVALLAPSPSTTLAMIAGPPGLDGITNTTLALADAGQEPGLVTDAAVAHIVAKQTGDGYWTESSIIARTPMSGSDITMTINAMRAIQLYPIPARRAEIDARVARARAWLAAQRPATPYEKAEILLGLAWAAAPRADIDRAIAALRRVQNKDGGWSQLPGHASDAYATAVAIRALKEAKQPVPPAAIDFLTRTQLEDGSWYVRGRAVKLQPYFQSGFPHEHEQWISYVATAQAATALLR